MNRLWVRLSLAFAAIVIISFGAISFTARLYFADNNLRSLALAYFSREAGLIDRLEAYYGGRGSWQGVSTLLEGADSALFFNAASRRVLILTDPEGQVLYTTAGAERPSSQEASQLQEALPISVDGRIVGFLDLIQRERPSGRLFSFEPPPDDISPDFGEGAREFLLQVLLMGAVLATVFGMLVSRWLSAPLIHLVDGTQAIAKRDLSFRVAEQGSDEMREVSNSFNRMAAALEDAETLRRSMLNDIAHELRTPLTVLEGNLRAILDDVYPLEKTEIARLYDQTRHLHRLVDDLRLLAQAEARQLPLQRTPSDLVALLEEAELFAPLAGEKNISLDTSLPRSSVLAAVDRMRFTQALQNLLTNALQHTPAGGVIRLSLRTEEETAAITVADNGDGIATEDMSRVFDRFYRVDKNRTRDTGGIGLGLAIAQALVEAHDGEIEVSSAGVGQGSTFTVRLPLAGGEDLQEMATADKV